MRGATALRREMNTLKTYQELRDLLANLPLEDCAEEEA